MQYDELVLNLKIRLRQSVLDLVGIDTWANIFYDEELAMNWVSIRDDSYMLYFLVGQWLVFSCIGAGFRFGLYWIGLIR